MVIFVLGSLKRVGWEGVSPLVGGFHLGPAGESHIDGMHGGADVCYVEVDHDVGAGGVGVQEGRVAGGEAGVVVLGRYFSQVRQGGGVLINKI